MTRWLFLLLFVVVACDSGGGPTGPGDGDVAGDGDADGDTDGDADGDTDGDADGDTDGDADGDTDADVEPPACDPASVVAAISTTAIGATITDLTSYPSRSSHDVQEEVAALLRDRLLELGLTVNELEYTSGGERWVNLEIVLPGTELGGEIYAAGAHFDTTGGVAPGADDNASGTAGVMEIARVLADCRYRRTLRLLLFSNEEIGAVGSAAYARAASAAGDDIRGFLNLDMIGYGTADEDLDIATRPVYASLLEAVVGATERWTTLATVTHVDDHCG